MCVFVSVYIHMCVFLCVFVCVLMCMFVCVRANVCMCAALHNSNSIWHLGTNMLSPGTVYFAAGEPFYVKVSPWIYFACVYMRV